VTAITKAISSLMGFVPRVAIAGPDTVALDL
jgi:hypothetical protein